LPGEDPPAVRLHGHVMRRLAARAHRLTVPLVHLVAALRPAPGGPRLEVDATPHPVLLVAGERVLHAGEQQGAAVAQAGGVLAFGLVGGEPGVGVGGDGAAGEAGGLGGESVQVHGGASLGWCWGSWWGWSGGV